MLFGPERGSIFTVFDKFASNFTGSAIIIVVALMFGNRNAFFENCIVLALAFFMPVLRFIKYMHTYYSVDEETLYIKSGYFSRQSLEVPLESITTVDFSQNMMFRLLNIYSIKVDNASNYGGNGSGKVELALKKEKAVRFKQLLLSKSHGRDKEDDKTLDLPLKCMHKQCVGEGKRGKIVVPVKHLLIMGTLKSKRNALIELISAGAALIGVVNVAFRDEAGYEDVIYRLIVSIPWIKAGAIIAIVFMMLSAVLGAVFTLVRYYGFSIQSTGEAILIEYGLFTRKKYSLLKSKISGVEFVQPLIMKAFGVGYMNIMAVGYGDVEDEEKSLCHPLIEEKKLNEFMLQYVPELARNDEIRYDSSLRSLRYFFICPRCAFVLVLTIICIFTEILMDYFQIITFDTEGIWIMLSVIIIITVVSVVLECRHSAVKVARNNISLVSGSFTVREVIVKREVVESVSDSGTLTKRRKGIVSVTMGILAPDEDSIKTVRNVPLKAFERLKNMINY